MRLSLLKHAVGSVALGALLALAAAPATHAQTYWFESYQRSIELIESGQLESASVLLEELLVEFPTPKVNTRVPGERVVDYLPYFQRARIQALQGNFDGAARNLAISEAFGEIMADRRSEADFQKLRQEVDQKRTVVVASK